MIPGAVRIIHAVLCGFISHREHRSLRKNLCVLCVLRGFISHREHREHRDLRKNLCVHAMQAGSPRTQVPS